MGSVTFAIIGDLHVGSVIDEVPTFVRLVNRLPVDFALFMGDLVHEATDANVETLGHELRRLKKPYYLTLGNHDTGNMSSGYNVERKIRDVLPGIWNESFTYNFRAGDWNFIVAGMGTFRVEQIGFQVHHRKGFICERGYMNRLVGDHAIRLQKLLEASGDTPTVLTLHVPLIRMSRRIYKRGCYEQVRLLEEPQILALLDEHPNVRVVLSGHNHFNQVEVLNDAIHCVTQSVKAYGPYGDPNGIRIMELTENSVHSYMLWEDSSKEPAAEIGTLQGDRSFEWHWPVPVKNSAVFSRPLQTSDA